MAFTELFCRSGGNQLNGGGLATNAEPPTAAAYTCVNSNWDGTSVFTPTDGSTPASTVNVGDFASVYLDAAVVAVYVARVTIVAAGVNGAITLSTTAKMGAVPASGANGRSIKVGGAWKGPNAADGFPLTLIASTLTNAAGDIPRVNMKNDAQYNVTAATTTTANGPWVLQGYTATAGDLGKFTWDGGTSVAGYVVLTNASSVARVVDGIFSNNGNSGNTSIVAASGGSQHWLRCVFSGARANGLSVTGTLTLVESCEAFGNNLSNTASQGGFASTVSTTFVRCKAHDNTTANAMGFIITGGPSIMIGCITDSNGSRGFNMGTIHHLMTGCDAYNNGSDGVAFTGGSAAVNIVENCNFVKNAGWGINGSGGGARIGMVKNCGFGTGTQANTSGTTTGLKGMTEEGSVTYASGVTPWVDPVNGNFSINLAAAKGTGYGEFTETANGSGTVAYSDIGAAQHQDSGGGSMGARIFTGM